jgi:heme A synthase
MLDNSRPQTRAAVKTVMFLVSVLVTVAVLNLGAEMFGLAAVASAAAALLFCYLVYIFYTISLSQEQYRDQLQELQKTIRK